jgi:hypothetical protein
VLANPPFAGALDYEATAKDLQRIVKTKKTELLFLALFLRLLKIGGRATVIVPDGRRSRVSRWAANAEFEVSGPRRCVVLKTVSTRGSHASGAPGCHAQRHQCRALPQTLRAPMELAGKLRNDSHRSAERIERSAPQPQLSGDPSATEEALPRLEKGLPVPTASNQRSHQPPKPEGATEGDRHRHRVAIRRQPVRAPWHDP